MNKSFIVLFAGIIACFSAVAQNTPIDKQRFFEEDKIIKATLVTKVGKILNNHLRDNDSIPSSFTFYFDDSSGVAEKVMVSPRGQFRRKNCVLSPLKLNFKNPGSSYSTLGSLKLVSPCQSASVYNQYILMEYLIYKMYNLFTEKSYRVRLMQLTVHDTADKRDDIACNAFLIEDTKDMAKRNKMAEWKKVKVLTEQTNREQMTLVNVFQYMIGNTDFSVPGDHNIKLIYAKDTQQYFPYAVPYDFDYCGLVDAPYAIPSEMFNIENVRQRVYRGFPRTMEELEEVFDVFRQKKQAIYDLINGFHLLKPSSQKEMIAYLEEFYKIIDNKKRVEEIFIKGARKE